MIKKIFKKAAPILCVLAVLIAAGLLATGIWLHNNPFTPQKISIYQKFPYPLALVNGSPVLMKDFLFRLKLAQNFPAAAAQQDLNAQIYNQMIAEAETAQVASRYGVDVSAKEVDDALSQMATSENQLAAYSLNVDEFKNDVIKPQLLAIKLQIWFNSQRELNAKAYNLADSLLSGINSGENMGLLAAEFTQDGQGIAAQGDLGFVDPTGLLPELREPVLALKINQAAVLPSRSGLHIVRLEAQNGNLLHLRQIFLTTSDFNQWLAGQQSNFKVWQLVKI